MNVDSPVRVYPRRVSGNLELSNPKARISALDTLRGFTLCGIVFINIGQVMRMRALPRALRNLLERDRMFTGRLHEETTRLELPIIEVDTMMTEDDLAERVAEAFRA